MSISQKKNVNRVFLFGDSITQGLGSRKISFEKELARILGSGFEVINLASTGTTIDYALKLLDRGEIVPTEHCQTICIVLYGNVDAQIRPNRKGKVFPCIPKRYKGGGMLMPRPFYSRSFYKRMGQHLDNMVRRFLSCLVKAIDGTEQWVRIEPFSNMYSLFLDRLIGLGFYVVCCSCVYIDEKLFPGSPKQYELFNDRIKAAALSRQLPYVDLYKLFRDCVGRRGWESVYNMDHFHPNGEGYRLIAEAIASTAPFCSKTSEQKGNLNE